jgi:hypothetical protein
MASMVELFVPVLPFARRSPRRTRSAASESLEQSKPAKGIAMIGCVPHQESVRVVGTFIGHCTKLERDEMILERS